ncbi:hypothetical protein GEW_12371 [Pasteurella multocida subsp. gallicida str. Anand1_poultry]|nr:hypothetical protein GEW_12371 [Pasteurella multocida subsp. gallicida str. Anand1_poultry]
MVEEKKGNWQAFDGVKRVTITTGVNRNAQYEDNLVYKF